MFPVIQAHDVSWSLPDSWGGLTGMKLEQDLLKKITTILKFLKVKSKWAIN